MVDQWDHLKVMMKVAINEKKLAVVRVVEMVKRVAKKVETKVEKKAVQLVVYLVERWVEMKVVSMASLKVAMRVQKVAAS